LCSDEVSKEALQTILNSCGGKVKFIWLDPEGTVSRYWIWDDSSFQIETRVDSLGCWTGYYTAEALSSKASVSWNGASVGVAQRKNLNAVEEEIQGFMKKASEAYGSEISWNPDYAKLHAWLVENDDQYAKSESLGNIIRDYVQFFTETFIKFIENADNKEAIQEKMTTPRFGFAYLPKDYPEYVKWAWGEDGALLMEVVGAAFGYWITESYYSLDKLEATL
jgi:hypothetical protein